MNSNQSSLLKGQVIAVFKDRYLVEFNEKKIIMEVSGRFKYISYQKSDYPQIGDYVKFRLADDYLGIIEGIEDRRSTLERLDVGKISEKHILAANVDIVFICMSLNNDFNTIKLRNYLSLTYGANFQTVILLTKKDLCLDVDSYIETVKQVSSDQIHVISAYDEEDIDMLVKLISINTACFIGSSGVGKSTLINKIIGEDRLKTNKIRLSDSQGRHTTVNRELIHLNNGGKVIDTPGIRIVSSYFVSEENFADIFSFSKDCRYSDCTHNQEPGCKVKEALYNGELPQERFDQYLKAMRLNRFNRQREQERERLNKKRLVKGR